MQTVRLNKISTKAPKQFNKEKTKAKTLLILKELTELQNLTTLTNFEINQRFNIQMTNSVADTLRLRIYINGIGNINDDKIKLIVE